ncbi:hypothetical protein IFM89_001232 [Coptis chinensis]|uniref:Pentatricopeptide repeat-containing protein n=1 Tax=Coptis chinensis TaxID=261450 RepID=A0A835LFY0_9MAGN|nr:hypothetical protein IFM89_001232 [Coptis chinensis]
MFSLLKPKLTHIFTLRKLVFHFKHFSHSTDFNELCNIVSNGIGGLDDLEASLNSSKALITPFLVTQVLDSCKNEVPTRRLLRFFSWSNKSPECRFEDGDFNHAIRVFAEKKDLVALDILVSSLRKEQRVMEVETFGKAAETLVKCGKEDEAVGIFKNLDKFQCAKDGVAVSAIVHALCAKGHAKKAEGVVWHHRSKISGIETCIYRSLLHGWCVHGNVKEARRILNEMKRLGLELDSFCYDTLLRCLCKRNLKFNPSGLVPEAFNIMMEMRSYKILPTAASFNILLSCLGKTRRVKEAIKVLNSMRKSGCSPDWVSYYLVVRVLYLSGRFGKGNMIVDEMIKEGVTPEPRFYHDLLGVLCGVERVGHALELFERMKKSGKGDYGSVYDLLIPKLCRGGEFEKGRLLWDEAMKMGITLQCSSDVLDPTVTEVFMPNKKVEEVSMNKSKKLTIKKTKKLTMKKTKKKSAPAKP